jgi:uncharacterized protein
MQRFDEEKTIVIYGGEPLMNFETVRYLLELIGQYKASKKLPLKTLVIINTNGTLITKDIADILAASGVSVSISLDGATARANACRKFVDGKPAFDSVLRGLNIAQEAGCACSLSTTMTEETIKDERQIVEMAERLHIQSMGLNTLMTDDYFRVSDDYYEKSADFLIRAFMLLREKGIYEDRIMRKLKTFVDAQRYSESSPYLYDCGAAGGNQVIIAPNGQVGLCQGYLNNREYFPTTVFCEDFIPEEDAVYLEWNRRTPITMTQCLHCEALGICGGGCPMNAKTWGSNHSIWDLDESFCVHAKKTLEWMIWDLYSKIDD